MNLSYTEGEFNGAGSYGGAPPCAFLPERKRLFRQINQVCRLHNGLMKKYLVCECKLRHYRTLVARHVSTCIRTHVTMFLYPSFTLVKGLSCGQS